MTNMFKKSLLATALFATAGVANAAVINPTDPADITVAGQTPALVVTTQYLAGNDTTAPSHSATVLNANEVTVVLGAEYTNDDTITLTFSAPLAAALPTSRTTTGAANQVTLGLISGGDVGDNTATYRVTSRVNLLSVIGTVLTFDAGDIKFAKAAATSGVTVSFSAQTNNGLPLDTAGGARRTAELFKVVDQFVTTPAPNFSRVIDVETQRRSFVELTGGSKVVTGTVTINEVTADGLRGTGNIKHTLNGDFSWVRDTAPNSPGITPAAGTFTVNGCTSLSGFALTASAVTFTCTNFGAVGVTIDPEAQKSGAPTGWTAPVLPTQTLTLTSEVALTGPVGSAKPFDGTAVGNWTLNGSSVYIPYMLYGPTAEQTIQLTNQGSQSGDIFATAVVGGNTLDLGKVGVSQARTVTSLNAAIRNAMVAKGVNLSGPGNFAVGLTLVTNVPADDVAVYSAYQRGNGDRLVIVNDSNGAK